MSGGVEGERSRQEVSSHQADQPEPSQRHGEGAINSRTPLRQEQQGWHDRPHAELVDAFRGLIRKEHQALGDRARFFPPIKIIHDALLQQVQYILSDDKREKQRGAYFAQMLDAWDVITFEQYNDETHLMTKHHAAINLDTHYNRAKARNAPHPEIIALDDPLQVRIIDAAAEAAGIPHQRGQTSYEIPQKLWDYEARVRQASEERRHRGI
jgi:hypothetical protein